MVRSLATAVLVAALAAPVEAVAAPPSVGEALFLQAAEKHKAGDLAGAVSLLEGTQKADDHPTVAYNLAVLYDKLGDKAKAAANYEKYLRSEPEDAVLVMQRFSQMAPAEAEAYAKAVEASRKPDEGEVEETPAEGAVAAAGHPKGGGKGQGEVQVPAEGEGGGGAQGGGTGGGGAVAGGLLTYALLGTGTVALALGATFGALTVSDVNSFMQARVRDEAQQHADAARSHQVVANLAYIAGLAAVGAGVALLLMDDRRPAPAQGTAEGPSEPKAVLSPLAGPGVAGAAVTLDF